MSRIDIGAIAHLIRAGQVPALSIRQPWAYRILHRGKDIENRSWETKYRGWIMVHAGQALDKDAIGDIHSRPSEDEALLPRGAILGIVKIAGVTRDDPSPWFIGPVGLILQHPFRLPSPIPCKGRLGLFKPDRADREKVIAGLLARARQRRSS